VSKFAMMMSSPNDLFHIESFGISPLLSNWRKFHECVVWSLCILFKKIDITLGFSAFTN
jgi:hypothetical protein